MTVEEVWYDMPRYEGVYQYSNTLKIRSVNHWADSKKRNKKLMKGRELKVHLSPNRYASVHLSKDGKVEHLLLHKFFATQFIPNPHNKKYVNHKNGNKHDYTLDNLEFATKSEDVQHAYDTGLRKQKRGADCALYGKKRPEITGQNSRKAKWVMNKSTGIFYESCVEAAMVHGILSRNLSRYLSGTRTNKTDLIYV